VALASWLVTPLFLVAFGLVLAFYDPLLRLAWLFGPRAEEMVAGLLQWSVMQTLRLAGTRFEIERADGVKGGRGYIFVSNHQSLFDVALLGGLMLTNFPKYVAKKELSRGIPSVSFHLRAGGNAIIDRNHREQATSAIRRLGEQAERRGVSAVIYPEGTRARDGALRPFKPVGFLTLLEAAPSLPVVSVAIDGSWELVRHRFWPVPFGRVVHFRVGEPIPRREGEEGESLLRRVEEEIRSTIEGWRGTGRPAPGSGGLV
jgi:1-acyl-sn-glycerol-3-phosphate acyltransferase